MKIYIYQIWFPTSKKSYIGLTIEFLGRMLKHLKAKSLVGNALRKYDDWIIKKLHTVKTYEEAFRIEIEEIRNFNCVAPNGYNLTRGGDGTFGYNWTKEARDKISKTSIGRKIPEVVIANKLRIGQPSKLKGRKNPAVSKSNKRRIGEKRSGKALINIQIGNLQRDIKKLERNP